LLSVIKNIPKIGSISQISLVLIEAKEEHRQKIMDLLLPFVNPPRNREGNIFYPFLLFN
jgi:quinol monooxygenase YgiN